MLIGGIVAAIVVIGVVAGVALRRRTQDDVHSVEHYHRQLHTLEELGSHPSLDLESGNGEASYPASAFRVSSSRNVRLTEPGGTIVPPVPPPPVPNPAEPMTFDDTPAEPEPSPKSFMTGTDDPAMHSIDRRPRRLGGPLAAVAAVIVLIVVLIVTGLHSNTPSHRGTASTTVTTATHAHSTTPRRPSHHSPPPTTTPPPVVSAPSGASAHAATYQVADASYSLALSAKNGECWVSATDSATGKVLYTGTLFSGQSQTVAADGPVDVVAGAPGAFVATVNGTPVTLPPGSLAPFTLTFQPPGSTATGGTGAGSTGTGTGTTGTASG